MNYYKTIAVIGGTGKAGKYLIKHLVALRYRVKMLVHKTPSAVSRSNNLQIIEGDARDADTLRSLFSGCDAVLSMLGQPKGVAEPVFSEVTANVISVMTEFDLKRYIAVTGLSIDVPGDNKSEYNQALSEWVRTNYPGIVADKQREYELLAQSDLSWTLLRLPMIRETDALEPVVTNLHDCPGSSISTASLAGFVTDIIDNSAYLKAVPFVASVE